MEDAFAIGVRLKKETNEAKEQNQLGVDWQLLRSLIYTRDNGLCWICRKFVPLREYDLGHLVDRCKGGEDDYGNLAVMHRKCNLSKPKHITIDEHMTWLLKTRFLCELNIPLFNGANTKDAPSVNLYQNKTISAITPTIKKEPRVVKRDIVSQSGTKTVSKKVHPKCPKCGDIVRKNGKRQIRRRGVVGKLQSYICMRCFYQWEDKNPLPHILHLLDV